MNHVPGTCHPCQTSFQPWRYMNNILMTSFFLDNIFTNMTVWFLRKSRWEMVWFWPTINEDELSVILSKLHHNIGLWVNVCLQLRHALQFGAEIMCMLSGRPRLKLGLDSMASWMSYTEVAKLIHCHNLC